MVNFGYNRIIYHAIIIMTKPTSDKAPKPIMLIQSALRRAWVVWLLYCLVIYPVLASLAFGSTGRVNLGMNGGVGTGMVFGVIWQLVKLIPALLLTPTIKRADAPYGLIVASLVMLIYLGFVGVYWFIHVFEHSPVYISVGFGFETLLLLIINVLLFVLLRRLPPMHKNKIRK